MAPFARRFIEAGARVVGGCCGTTPDHMKAIPRALRAVEPGRRTVSVRAAGSEARAVEPVPKAERSRLASGIEAGRFVISVEMLPPRGHDLGKNLERARLLREAGIDAINIPDGPRASARMSPMAMAVLLEREVGIETIIHYCCRDGTFSACSRTFSADTSGVSKFVLLPLAQGTQDLREQTARAIAEVLPAVEN